MYHRLDRLGIARRRTPPDRVRPNEDELRDRFLARGHGLRRIAADYHVTPQAVAGWLRHYNIEPRPSGTPPLRLDADAVIAGYLAGHSAPHLAAEHGCSPAAIYRCLDQAGIERRPPVRAITRDTLVDALAQHHNAEQIAAAHGISVSAVCRALRRDDLETNQQATRRRARERYKGLLAAAERDGCDPVTLEWLRDRAT